ncbi:SDR family NAD(P)-dependent oxidoreductase [Chromobacterium piscinae]|uniref:SDR family NAD(P)-dependent oxidoreductase n=1 Tax=Chromobacterium piscinae TaxID=686831 RepID=UPI003F803644
MSRHQYGDRFAEVPLFMENRFREYFEAKNHMRGEMDKALAALLWESLRSMGLEAGGGSVVDLTRRILGGPVYEKWLQETLAELSRQDYIRLAAGRYQCQSPRQAETSAWEDWRRRKIEWCQEPDLKAQIALVEATLLALPDILAGRRAATDVIFPDSSLALVEGIYKHNELAQHYNDALADIVERFIHETLAWNPSAKLRILEIGAGTGGTSAVVLEKISPYKKHIEEYCYTDISKAFLQHAEETFGKGNAFLNYRIFNVEEPLARQGMDIGVFDIVIAANVLHATKSIANTIRNAKALLANNGLLVLNEISKNSLFAHLTFGLLEGWWLYEDPFLRIPGSPALSPSMWKAVLEMEGFRSVFFAVESLHDLGQQIVVAESDGIVRQRLETSEAAARGSSLLNRRGGRQTAQLVEQDEVASAADLLSAAIAYFKQVVAETLKMPSDDIDPLEPLERYGLDSILIVKMSSLLKDVLGPVSSTIFFEHQTVEAIAKHFLAAKKEALTSLLAVGSAASADSIASEAAAEVALPMQGLSKAESNTRFAKPSKRMPPEPMRREAPLGHAGDIAIVGLSGRYPQAENIDEFWERLKNGVNCITEIPADRWDWRRYYDEEKGKKDSSYSRWGGFLADVDKFDPLFFRITPAEAEAMDPQARLFLEQAYSCIEDAGYTPAKLSGEGKVGVFVGVMNSHYPEAAAYWSVANRISYLFNFNGPSMAVDTACSSALTAIHLAIESIHSGTSECAIAGGVNLILEPEHYIKLTAMRMLASSDRCRAFGDGADGFVDGEGVGAILLKPLSKARQDGDHIYGVIKGSMLNAGGRTNGYTVPNPAGQARLIAEALKRANVNARSVSYVEAHGTGTALGDPIEVEGLARAFAEDTEDKQFCALGSVKSNIGHGESAAGIAGLTKVLLQMKHGKLAPTLNASRANPEIDFAATPFYLQYELSDWKRPAVKVAGNTVEYPRIAGISSFGAGGANAHLVVEEYDAVDVHASRSGEQDIPVLFVFSAKGEDSLHRLAEKFVTAIHKGELASKRAADIAYTLQVGREPMEERLAIIAATCDELAAKLASFIKYEQNVEGCFAGNAKRDKGVAGHGQPEQLGKWLEARNYSKLAESWVNGLSIDWMALPSLGERQRVSLPTYAFSRERYWMPRDKAGVRAATPLSEREVGTAAAERLEASVAGDDAARPMLFLPAWLQKEEAPAATAARYEQHHIILCGLEDGLSNLIAKQLPHSRTLAINPPQASAADRFAFAAQKAFDAIKSLLICKPADALIQIAFASGTESGLFAGLHGLLRTAELENSRIAGQLIEFEQDCRAEQIVERLMVDSCHPEDRRVRYQDEGRLIASWRETPFAGAAAPAPWRNGVYLISGGLGGLGLLVAENAARHMESGTIVLVGRSALSPEASKKLGQIECGGVRIAYLQCDVSKQADVNGLIQTIQGEYGSITGILHAAGVTRDNVMLGKTFDEWQAVFAAKVHGAVCLDEATKELALDFFVLFSSATGVLGNIGQADYATANSFLDAYAMRRQALTLEGRRRGKTISIDWPLWRDGGMRVSADVEATMRNALGMTPMSTTNGMHALHQALAGEISQLLVIEGDPEKVTRRLQDSAANAAWPRQQKTAELCEPAEANLLQSKVVVELKTLYGKLIKLDPSRIDTSEPLESYGIDSLLITQLNQELEAVFGEVSKTLFYEHQTLDSLAQYLAEEYVRECRLWTGFEAPESRACGVSSEEASTTQAAEASTSFASDAKGAHLHHNIESNEHIAIVGMSGRYPQAANLAEYWNNLLAGKDCITEIPPDRWPLDDFFESDPNKAVAQGKSYCKWGGFLEGFADFDPFFFNISPREAITIDPQERLFIQSCWEVLEDAGYTKQRIEEKHRGEVGVFVGITKTGFDLHGFELVKRGETIYPHTSFSSVANRVSYLLNLRGPSMPIDTMCSSSLTAIHEACEHIRRGECEMAIAGGVNLYLHPTGYIGLSAKHMLSQDGKCKSFGAEANGFVPGEGVGAILIKKLSQAIKDGDHIYALIAGTSINHGGKTNGYTVPNPNAQADLIRKALDKAGIHARTVSYVEAHGTGTELGDPVELAGLTQAFRQDSKDAQYCALGSVKSNIGHLEAAAGIAGVSKIVLQMNQQTLVRSLHAEQLNPNIHFARTPFFVQRENAAWQRPVVAIDGQEAKEYPRIACISSFGAGGSNAHIVIQECHEDDWPAKPDFIAEQAAMIVLSARTQTQLREQAQRLLAAIGGDAFGEDRLRDIAYTLQAGREQMEERLGLTCSTVSELKDKLSAFCSGAERVDGLFVGRSRKEWPLSRLAGDEDMAAVIDAWLRKRKFDKLLDLWVAGFDIDWEAVHKGGKPQRISLPAYPFVKERYWFDDMRASSSRIKSMLPERSVLHPLLHANTSDLSEQRYSSTFTGEEFFFRDHVIQGKAVLPGVASLEMALEAARRATGANAPGMRPIALRHVVWARPITIIDGQPLTIHIGLFPGEGEQVNYEIYSEDTDAAEVVVHGQGVAEPCEQTFLAPLNLEAIRSACGDKAIDAEQCYAAYRSMGIDYGPSHQGIEQIYSGQGQVLAKIRLPADVAATAAQFLVHPSILDAALQSLLGFVSDADYVDVMRKALVPFALTELNAPNLSIKPQWVWAHYSADDCAESGTRKFDISLCDEAGNVGIEMKGFSTREFEWHLPGHGKTAEHDVAMLAPNWSELAGEASDAKFGKHVVLLCGKGHVEPERMAEMMADVDCVGFEAGDVGIGEGFTHYAVRVFERVQNLLAARTQGRTLLQVVVPFRGEHEAMSGLAGLLRTARAEEPGLAAQLIEAARPDDAQGIVDALNVGRLYPEASRIRAENGKHRAQFWRELAVPETNAQLPWKDNGVYLVTGGAGGIGCLFAEEICRRALNPILVLVGRSELDERQVSKLDAMRATGAQVAYRRLDVADAPSLDRLLEEIRAEFGQLNGILHCAGITRDAFILQKRGEDWPDVLAPKVQGIVNLDEASKDMALDMFVTFSSIAAVLGNPGQADYAAANAFMDGYAAYRNRLVQAGSRHGLTLSMNWPFWAEGGMELDKRMEDQKLRAAGLIPMRTETGLRAFYHGLGMGQSQLMVLEGNAEAISGLLEASGR